MIHAKVGSLAAFWPLLQPLLDALGPQRVCEIGVAEGAFTRVLLDWGAPRGVQYVGIDPAPAFDLAELRLAPELASLICGRSLDVLPQQEPCDAYFIDGDHNYYTVRNELDVIAHRTQASGRGALICLHDVGWPWGRRDMYHAPDAVPAEHRHAHSAELGVVPDANDLVDGGLRDPGTYVIALRAGGPRNGVLTAVEDFLSNAGGAAGPWRLVVVPAAYGLAILARTDLLTPACVREVERIAGATDVMGGFLRLIESNYQALYLFEEHVRRQADDLRGQVAGWEATYAALHRAYGDLAAHAESLDGEFARLLAQYRELEAAAGLGVPPPENA